MSETKPLKWKVIKNKKELHSFYLSKLSIIKVTANECGYAIGVHGSLKRDLDLIAVPWIDGHSNMDKLASNIQKAVCGFFHEQYRWTTKPARRVATSFPICWPEFGYGISNLGCIDLSVTF